MSQVSSQSAGVCALAGNVGPAQCSSTQYTALGAVTYYASFALRALPALLHFVHRERLLEMVTPTSLSVLPRLTVMYWSAIISPLLST